MTLAAFPLVPKRRSRLPDPTDCGQHQRRGRFAMRGGRGTRRARRDADGRGTGRGAGAGGLTCASGGPSGAYGCANFRSGSCTSSGERLARSSICSSRRSRAADLGDQPPGSLGVIAGDRRHPDATAPRHASGHGGCSHSVSSCTCSPTFTRTATESSSTRTFRSRRSATPSTWPSIPYRWLACCCSSAAATPTATEPG